MMERKSEQTENKVVVTLTFDLDKIQGHRVIPHVLKHHHTENDDNLSNRFCTKRKRRKGQGHRDLDL